MSNSKVAIVFDLDGTLVHSMPDLRIALNKVLVEEGRRECSPEEVVLMVGDGVPTLIRLGFEATGDDPGEDKREEVRKRFMSYYAGPMPNTFPWDGVIETLDKLKAAGHPMAVCTNKPFEATKALCDQLDLTKYFDSIVGGDTCATKKPEPEMLYKCMEEMGSTKDNTIMLGDSLNDVKVCRNAGIPVGVVSFGYSRGVPVPELGTDDVIDHFSDLMDLVQKYGNA